MTKIRVLIIVCVLMGGISACLPFAVTLPGGFELPSTGDLGAEVNLQSTLTQALENAVVQDRSCSREATVRPMASGNVLTESRNVGPFSEIVLQGLGEVMIQQGDSTSLEIKADENFIAFIDSRVDGDQLILAIREEVCILQSELEIQYHITVSDLTLLHIIGAGVVQTHQLEVDKLRIQLDGSAAINLSGLQLDTLVTDLNGTGMVQVSGIANNQIVNLNGVGQYQAGNLKSLSAEVKLNGTGSLEVWALSDLQVEVNGLGNVGYYGTPELRTTNTGWGEIERLGSR